MNRQTAVRGRLLAMFPDRLAFLHESIDSLAHVLGHHVAGHDLRRLVVGAGTTHIVGADVDAGALARVLEVLARR